MNRDSECIELHNDAPDKNLTPYSSLRSSQCQERIRRDG